MATPVAADFCHMPDTRARGEQRLNIKENQVRLSMSLYAWSKYDCGWAAHVYTWPPPLLVTFPFEQGVQYPMIGR